MISGINYNKVCKWSICPRYTQKFDINQIKENDLVFLNIDYIEHVIDYLNHNIPRYKFILVTQNSDRDFTQEMYNCILPYVNKIYAINATCVGDKLIKIPIGFNDTAINYINVEQQLDKTNLIYCNFKIRHHVERKECFDYFKKFDWVDIYSDGMFDIKQLPFIEFYNVLKTYKYCISPRGTGIDTHRNYESLYFGVIPIVKRNELTDLYEKFPILLVEDWKEITKEFLENSYEKLKSDLDNWLETNKNWNKTKFWINE